MSESGFKNPSRRRGFFTLLKQITKKLGFPNFSGKIKCTRDITPDNCNENIQRKNRKTTYSHKNINVIFLRTRILIERTWKLRRIGVDIKPLRKEYGTEFKEATEKFFLSIIMGINEEFVISGISGRFPECDNVEQFKKALLTGRDLLTNDERRYPADLKTVPKRSGKISDLDKFDASFFGIIPKQAEFMDPHHRLLLETTFEAIIDAGYNPEELRGTNTGVFVGVSMYKGFVEANEERSEYFTIVTSPYHAANRISHCFDFNGPSFSVDTACSGALYAFTLAHEKLKSGEIDYAIVCSANINFNPYESWEYMQLNVLSQEGSSQVFNKNRKGFVRSETVSSYLLQKKSNCRRMYAKIVATKANTDGYKPEGLNFPSSRMQTKLIKELHTECNISPNDFSYLELHGTGTVTGDAQETKGLVEVFSGKRSVPLLIGSVKSNMGHAESASGMASLTKLIIAMETGIIPATINVDPVDPDILAITKGTLEITTVNKYLKDGLLGANSFGITGANAHVVLKPVAEKKTKSAITKVNRLVQVSGRTEKAVNALLDEIEQNRHDEEFLSLIDEIHKNNIVGYDYRGYSVLGSDGLREVTKYSAEKRPIWFLFSGAGCQWLNMGLTLMHIEVFKNTFDRCANAIKPYGVDLMDSLKDESDKAFKNFTNISCCITSITVALVDLLASLGIVPDFTAGHSLGETGCAYVNGDITPEQAVLMAFARGYALEKTERPICQMAAIGLSEEEIGKILPKDIYIACVNSKSNVTISGLELPVKEFVKKISDQGIFARLVESSNVAFHSPYLMGAEKHLLKFLQKILANPKPRLSKWISTCVRPENSNEEWAQLNGAEYQAFNFSHPVRFDNIYPHIQKNAIIIEISPHALMQAILKREIGPENTLIGLMNKNAKNQEGYLLQSIGKIFNAGGQPNLREFYNDVTFPVSRGTKMLSPLIKWDHGASWLVPLWKNKDHFGKMVTISLNKEKYSYIAGHNIDGRILMPAAGYVELVWSVFAEQHLKVMTDMPVVFENIRFLRAVVLSKSQVKLIVNIMEKTGNFEIFEGGSVVVTGKIRIVDNISSEFRSTKKIDKTAVTLPPDSMMDQKDFYKELHLRRYFYSGLFKGVSHCNFDGTVAKLVWSKNFTSFLDTMLQIKLLENKNRDVLFIPTSIKKLVIDPRIHLQEEQQKYVTVNRDRHCDVIKTEAIEIFCPTISTASRRKKQQIEPVLHSYEFVCYNSPVNKKYNLKTSLIIAADIVLQNISGMGQSINIMDVSKADEELRELIKSTIQDRCGRKLLTTLIYSVTKLQNISKDIDALIVDESTPLEWENIVKANKKMFVLCIGNCEHIFKTTSSLDVIFKTPHLCLLKTKNDSVQFDCSVQILNHRFNWLEKLKEIARSNEQKNVLLYSENEENSGILGLMTCLQTEDVKFKCTSVFINQKAEPFSEKMEFYKKQLSKNLAFNVLFDDNWGTFVSIPLDDMEPKYVENAIISVGKLGDLSSLHWVEEPILKHEKEEIVKVSYFALNFKDVLIATGRIPVSKAALCLEYSGTTQNGKRLMGVIKTPCTKQLKPDPLFTWQVPESWNLEQAATVPVVYATNYYGMIVRGGLEEYESILIHSGSGAIGISAIRIALSLKATIFTTVGSEQKKQFLIKSFPQLDPENIGNSRDSSFYNLIQEKTKGKGVDMILNSLTSELFQASLNCLAECGRFIEIGREDLLANSHIDTDIFLKNSSFHGILLDEMNDSLKIKTHKLLSDGIVSGVVQPLPVTVFPAEDVESAFRYLSSRTHIGKVLIKVEDLILSEPKIYFSPKKVYIIIGGLGGMGLELAHWLFSKGARKVILNARRKPWNSYQTYCLDRWSKLNYSAVVDLNSTVTLAGTEKLLREAQKLGPIGGYFNSGMVLKDNHILCQTQALFEEVLQPKIYACEHMDILTRKYCPELDHFVVFSSIVASMGVIGQTNYGMANSALERLCEKRRRDNLPGMAIEWGPIGDVGVLTTERFQNKTYKHIEHQKIESCWKVLERCLIQNVTVGVSMVLAENIKDNTEKQTSLDLIAQVIGLKDIGTMDPDKTLQNIGIDSLMLSEIKQIIFHEYHQELDLEDIRKLTFGKLMKLDSGKK